MSRWDAGGTGLEALGIPTGLADLGAGALLVTFVATVLLAIFTGRLVVKMHYEAAVKRAEAAEAALATVTANNTTLTQAVLKSTVTAETMDKLLAGLQDAREKAQESR
jgi:hypothetical protein